MPKTLKLLDTTYTVVLKPTKSKWSVEGTTIRIDSSLDEEHQVSTLLSAVASLIKTYGAISERLWAAFILDNIHSISWRTTLASPKSTASGATRTNFEDLGNGVRLIKRTGN